MRVHLLRGERHARCRTKAREPTDESGEDSTDRLRHSHASFLRQAEAQSDGLSARYPPLKQKSSVLTAMRSQITMSPEKVLSREDAAGCSPARWAESITGKTAWRAIFRTHTWRRFDAAIRVTAPAHAGFFSLASAAASGRRRPGTMNFMAYTINPATISRTPNNSP